MSWKIALVSFVLALSVSNAGAATPASTKPEPSSQDDALVSTITKLDSAFFDAFNHCSSPDQLKKHASFLDPNVEFYHDKGGVSWTRKDYIDKTRQNVCGHFRRVLTAGTLEVFPIKGYGAIEDGRHEFCDLNSDKCFGQAKFLVVWHQTADGWKITRIFSYGHEALK